MEKNEIFDETFDPDRCESYILSVEVSFNGIIFCIKDAVRDMYISFVSFPFSSSLSVTEDWGNTIDLLLSQYEIFSHKFKKVFFSFDSQIFTIVPTDFFIPEKAKLLLELVHPLPNLFEVRFNNLPESKAINIFAIPSSLTSKWQIHQPQTQFIGRASPLIACTSIANAAKVELLVLTEFSEQFYTNVITRNKELQHCNSFVYYDSNDTVYHLINTCKLAGFEPNKLEITIFGCIEDAEGLEAVLAQYFNKVHINNSIDGHHYSYSVAKFKNIYWNLFNLSLCE